ncbi:PIN domain-like protein [Pilatotrama ljubarskyi]|nr:PIN domain-like protein [Pilatotrama ljubarskyi]
MGVLGLAPFIQKTCPEVIKTLPDRLRSLSGKKIVIDGTLITQRFHFAPIPHPFRHVVCWYRLIKHLQATNVKVICVFDGKVRSAAKQREMERRRRDRMLTAARGVFEVDRLSRLRRLTQSLQSWQAAPGTPEAAHELSSLKDLMEKMKPPPDTALSELLLANQHLEPSVNLSSSVPGVQGLARHSLFRLEGVFSIHDPYAVITDLPTPAPRSESERTLDDVKGAPPVVDESLTSKDLALDIPRLYQQYQQSIPRILSLTEAASERPAMPSPPTFSPEEIEEARVDYALSKSQHGLMIEEGKLWEQLASLDGLESIEDSVTSLAQALEAKSSLLSESYARRTHPPTTETYEQSKEILHAMGVPCVEPAGPYEAETLAASLVIHGHADYVASEDTDVLVYEVPLVRNIGSSTGPLVLISGANVRAALKLDRTQYIDFALLLGTDFSQRIKNVGPARALKFIREHGSIERVLEHERQYPPRVPPEEYLQQVELARLVFQTLPPIPEDAHLEQGKLDEQAVWAILDKYNLHRYVADDWAHQQALVGNYFSDDPAAA